MYSYIIKVSLHVMIFQNFDFSKQDLASICSAIYLFCYLAPENEGRDVGVSHLQTEITQDDH